MCSACTLARETHGSCLGRRPSHLGITACRLGLTPRATLAGEEGTLKGVAWFVQASDLHLSRFAAEQMPQYGDKQADFRAFAECVLKPLQPKALLLTGDLVDAKTQRMQGQQYEDEWQVGAKQSWLVSFSLELSFKLPGRRDLADAGTAVRRRVASGCDAIIQFN